MNICSNCGAFIKVPDGHGMGACLASGELWDDYDKRGTYDMVAWCDSCSRFSKHLSDCLKKKTREEVKE